MQFFLRLPQHLLHGCASRRTDGEVAVIGGHRIAKRCGMQTHQRTSRSKFFTVLRNARCKGSPEFFSLFLKMPLLLGIRKPNLLFSLWTHPPTIRKRRRQRAPKSTWDELP